MKLIYGEIWLCVAAGADLVITNTYQASLEGFEQHLGVTRDQAYELIVRAVELAKRARTLYLEEYQDYLTTSKKIYVFLMFDKTRKC